MQKYKKTFSAFTLAEVLITIVIIGVVAALTIPSVVVSYKKHQTVTQLKKVYSALSQITNKSIAEHGPIQNWDFDVNNTKAFVDKYIVPHLSVIKNCGYETNNGCEFKYAKLNNPGNFESYGNDYYKLILADGAAVYFQADESPHVKDGKTINRTYLIVDIDVNGQKEPNVWGKDVFKYVYWIDNDNLSGTFKPEGAFENREDAKGYCNKNKAGRSCANLIMLDNWQIKSDYPW